MQQYGMQSRRIILMYVAYLPTPIQNQMFNKRFEDTATELQDRVVGNPASCSGGPDFR
jgi:hypothetical protein